MATHTATVTWTRDGATFTDNRYSRTHEWSFDGGARLSASASPHVVPAPLSDPRHMDPEEAFVASLSSCHMLWFLSIAAGRGFVADSYADAAIGRMERTEGGKLAFTRVVLRPEIRWAGENVPDEADVRAMHEEAHEKCFIASSVRAEVVVE